MAILITGVNGFLGSALAAAFVRKGTEVIGVDRKEAGFLPESVVKNPRVTLCVRDMTAGMADLAAHGSVEAVYHLASCQPSSSALTYADFYAGNVATTLNCVELARVAGAKLFVYVSTINIAGVSGSGIISEETQPDISNYYTLTKYTAENIAKIALKASETKTAVVRFPSLFGKNHRGGLIHTYYQTLRLNQDLELYARGESTRNLLYVDDAVDLLCRLYENTVSLDAFELFVAGNAEAVKTMDLAQTMAGFIGSRSRIIPVDKGRRENVSIDISKAADRLGFRPAGMREGLKRYCEEMQHEI